MNTLSIPHNSSAKGHYFQPRSGSSPEQQAEELPLSTRQADASSPLHADPHDETELRLWRDVCLLIKTALVLVMIAIPIAMVFPKAFSFGVCLLVSSLTLMGVYCWASHRGDAEIGVSDTQGRDSSTHNSTH